MSKWVQINGSGYLQLYPLNAVTKILLNKKYDTYKKGSVHLRGALLASKARKVPKKFQVNVLK